MIEALAALVPVTALVAIAIFLGRECLEWRRRKKANQIKLRVYKRALGYESLTMRRAVDHLHTIAKMVVRAPKKYKVCSSNSGRHKIKILALAGYLEAEEPVVIPNLSTLEKLIIEVGQIDPEFSMTIEKMARRMLKIRNRVEELLDMENELNHNKVVNFWAHVDQEVKEAYKSLDIMHKCTATD